MRRHLMLSMLIVVAGTFFVIQSVNADLDYEFIENPPKFYLAKNHVYLEIESTQFTKDDFSEVDYIYVNPSGEEYEFGVKEYNGSDACKVVRQSSSTTYFHCELVAIPNNTFERLVIGFKKEQGATTISRLIVGYKNPPVQGDAGLPSYTKTFVYSSKFVDSDKDGFDDAIDNCPYAENPDQAPVNNCPSSFTLDQPDDGQGEVAQQNQGSNVNSSCGSDPTAAACDVDGDKIFGASDTCPLDAEIYQADNVSPVDGVKDGCPGSTLRSSSSAAPLSENAAPSTCSMMHGRSYGAHFTPVVFALFFIFVVALRFMFVRYAPIRAIILKRVEKRRKSV